MRQIFFLVLLFITTGLFAQAPANYTNINGRYRWIAGMFDSTFHIPKGTTPSLRTGGSTNSGGLFYNTSDSSVYTYTGTQWIKLRGSLNSNDTTNKYVTQVYKKSGSDSIFYVKGGIHTWAFNDSTGSAGGGGGGKIYYFNGGVSMGTFGGFTMYELGDTANTGAAANFTRSTTGNIANFITDSNKPGLLQIPAGVWTVDAWMSETGGGANHAQIWAVLEKWDGSTITTIATSPIEEITEGNTPNLYTWAITVPTTSLLVTDRIIIQFYITNTNGKTVTLYTQNGYVGEVHTTFTTGIGALNGLTAPAQYLTTGTSGTDFNISSVTATHTFNLPTASATNRGALSSADWTTFNNKGSVSSIATNNNTGITGGTITTTGTLAIDTLRISTRAWRQKGIDSVAALINSSVSGTSGQVAYFNSTNSITGSNNLFWDNANSRLGVGTTTPSAYGHGGTNVITEIQNSATAANSQAHLILSSGATANTGAIGSITFALPNSSAAVKRAVVINSDITANSSTTISANLNFATSDAGNVTTRMTITSGGTLIVGNGETAASPSTGIISGTGGSGTNIAGAEFRIRGGASTGSGVGGPITFYTSAAGSSGTGVNAATERARFTTDGRLGIATTTVGSSIQVNGNTAIGYSGSTAAPTNGLAVAGVVGIGSNSVTNGTTYGGAGQVNMMKISSSGYPALEINSTTDGGGSIQFTHGTNLPNQVRGFIGYNSFGGVNADLNIANIANGPIIFATNNSERMRIFGSGNVFIGSSPVDGGFRLDVNGTARVQGSTTITGSTTASAGVARGINATPTLVAAANNDVLVGLDINPTFTNGAFTGVMNYGARIQGIIFGRGSGGVDGNVAIGAGANSTQMPLGKNTTGSFNIAIGYQALSQNTTGGSNVAIGVNAQFNGTVSNCVIIGASAVQSGGANNTVAIGSDAFGNLSGANNVGIGTTVLNANTLGANNTAIGTRAGRGASPFTNANTTGTNNIFIGYESIGVSATDNNRTWIGNSSTTSTWLAGNVLIGTTTDAGFRLDVNGTARVQGLITTTGGVTSTGGLLSQQTGTNSGRMTLLNLRNTGGGFLSGVGTSMAIAFTNRESGGVWSDDFIELKVYNNGVGTTTTGYNFYTHNNQAYATASVLAMSINGTNVGIGVESPTNKLQVVPDNNQTGFSISGSSLTGSNAQSLVSLSQTWNTTGNPTAFLLNITNTASGATADLMELQVGGVAQFIVGKSGTIQTTAPAGGTAKPWKLGNVAVVSPTSPDRTIEVEIDGVTYYIHAKTTNN